MYPDSFVACCPAPLWHHGADDDLCGCNHGPHADHGDPHHRQPRYRRQNRRRRQRWRHRLAVIGILVGMIMGMPPGMDGAAEAQLGFGGIVYDPKNHAQNLLTAARTLNQINNQIRQLENEARMLSHQARNLTPLGTSLSPELAASLHETRRLMMAASALSYEINRLEVSFDRLFPNQYAADTGSRALDRRTRDALDVARAGYRESLSAQARLMTELGGDAARLEVLMAESAKAPGGLAATQAGNELLGLATKQIMQLQSVTIAAARAEALKEARAGALKGTAEARYRRFVGDRMAYTRD